MSNIFWTDSHCHLDLIDEDIATILNRAQQKNVNRLISIGIDVKSSKKVISYTNHHQHVYGTIGIHPHEAKFAKPADFIFLAEQLKNNKKIVALGECGYDFYYRNSSYEEQHRVFKKQLEIAAELNYPVVIHSRNAEQETMKILPPFLEKGLKILLHSFTSSDEMAEFGTNYDCYFSFNGIVTFPKAQNFLQLIKKIPLNRILLETDSPYLSPVPLRGKPNFPENVAIIGNYIANNLEFDLISFSKKINDNVENFFEGL